MFGELLSEVVAGIDGAIGAVLMGADGLPVDQVVGDPSRGDIEAMAMPCDPKKNTIMPWLWYARMSEDDLGAIYDYLRTVPAIRNDVVKRPSAMGS